MLVLPVAVISLVITCTVILVDDDSLRTSTGCNTPSLSLTLYVDSVKLTFNEVAQSVKAMKKISSTK